MFLGPGQRWFKGWVHLRWSTGEPTCGFSMWVGLPRSMWPQESQISLMRNQGPNNEHPRSPRQKLHGLWWPRLRSHTQSLPLECSGQSNHKFVLIRGKETKKIYLEYIGVTEARTPLMEGVSKNWQPCFKTTTVIVSKKGNWRLEARGELGFYFIEYLCTCVLFIQFKTII